MNEQILVIYLLELGSCIIDVMLHSNLCFSFAPQFCYFVRLFGSGTLKMYDNPVQVVLYIQVVLYKFFFLLSSPVQVLQSLHRRMLIELILFSLFIGVAISQPTFFSYVLDFLQLIQLNYLFVILSHKSLFLISFLHQEHCGASCIAFNLGK